MKQDKFESLYSSVWQQFEASLLRLEGGKSDEPGGDPAEFPQLYRRLCQYLALAQERQYSAYLIEHLNDLVLRGHHQMYRFHTHFRHKLIQFFVSDFPRLVRMEKRFILAAFAMLYLPALAIFGLILADASLVFSVLDPVQVTQFEEMYNPAREHLGRQRASDTNFMMFGYYIQNNISVAFRCFAGGMALMLGAVFALVFNGLLLGAVAGHLTNLGFSETFFTFVIAHGSFELTAIGLAGGAGLRLGYSILVPGRLSRIESLKRAADVSIRIMYGVVLMLLVAAFLEAFWSSSGSLPAVVKYGVGALLWVVVICYFVAAGRRREA